MIFIVFLILLILLSKVNNELRYLYTLIKYKQIKADINKIKDM